MMRRIEVTSRTLVLFMKSDANKMEASSENFATSGAKPKLGGSQYSPRHHIITITINIDADT
jgi:hypothetical protein